MKIAIKKVGEPLEITETTYKYRTECEKSILKTYADHITLSPDGCFTLSVDETGLMKELPINFYMAMANPDFPIQKIVGTVVFIRCKPVEYNGVEIYDYEVDDLTNNDLLLIEHMLNENVQKKLSENFVDYGKGFSIIRPV